MCAKKEGKGRESARQIDSFVYSRGVGDGFLVY